MRKLFSFRILFIYTIFILFISIIPVNAESIGSFPFLDKIIHFLIYTLLAFLAINTFRLNGRKNCYSLYHNAAGCARGKLRSGTSPAKSWRNKRTHGHSQCGLQIKVFLYCFFVGTVIECIQYFLPFRGFEGFDILANSAGSVAGILVRIT